MPGILAVCPPAVSAFVADDWWFSFTLYEDGQPANLAGAVIQATVRTLTDQAIIPATQQSAASAGANWCAGLVIITFPYTLTDGLTRIEYFIEIQSYQSGRYKTWPLIPVDCNRSTMPH